MNVMSQVMIKFKALPHFDEVLGLPQFQTPGAAGADVCACFADRGEKTLAPWERVLIPTGLAMEIPQGFEVQVRPRSGLSLKSSLSIANAPGTIDSDYRGELQIIVANLGPQPVTIKHGDRLAQLVIGMAIPAQFQWVSSLNQTERGESGFGSTGIHNA